MAATIASEATSSLSERAASRRQWRHFVDRLTAAMMAVGGISVIIAILLIFVYLAWVVTPLFQPASLSPRDFRQPLEVADARLIALDEYAEIATVLGANGRLDFHNAHTGARLDVPGMVVDDTITAVGDGPVASELGIVGLRSGAALVFKHEYAVSYPDNVRLVTPAVVYPFGEEAIPVSDDSLISLAVAGNEDQGMIAAIDAQDRVWLVNLAREVSFLDDSVTVEADTVRLQPPGRPVRVAVNDNMDAVFVATAEGEVHYFQVGIDGQPDLVDTVQATPEPAADISEVAMLTGGISLLVGDTSGRVTQWFPLRDENNDYTLARVRAFKLADDPITAIAPEHARKGFAAGDAAGRLGLFHTTAERTLLRRPVAEQAITRLSMAPRADALVFATVGRIGTLEVNNPHPEVSLRSLWGKVWYESRAEPLYIWQSSSASSDFEPKFSLTPLAFGTLKAAFYAMLFAVPLAIAGAIYTAYFMSPKMRGYVKPTIEVMEALPTVILGFLAGLWLAPLVEQNLPAVLGLMVVLPLSVMLAALAWSRLPDKVRHQVPDGWEAAILVPVVILAVLMAFAISHPLEAALFDGNMPMWLTNTFGIDYDQRNSLVVGMAMGFAVIPTIFSISEDAVFSVPKHLTVGSLALGATPWQTMTRVVLLTASPGIFSGVMIGFGRAVGETMIVLMATGNTPVIDVNIFQGFRALSANIAVEMPESEVGSTHYRILFLAALVLFLATFVVNTLAELVRQHLRSKYSSL